MLNVRMVANDGFRNVEEMVMSYFEILLQYLLGRNEGSHVRSQTGQPDHGLKSELGTVVTQAWHLVRISH
jgi:hypothetical protein